MRQRGSCTSADQEQGAYPRATDNSIANSSHPAGVSLAREIYRRGRCVSGSRGSVRLSLSLCISLCISLSVSLSCTPVKLGHNEGASPGSRCWLPNLKSTPKQHKHTLLSTRLRPATQLQPQQTKTATAPCNPATEETALTLLIVCLCLFIYVYVYVRYYCSCYCHVFSSNPPQLLPWKLVLPRVPPQHLQALSSPLFVFVQQ